MKNNNKTKKRKSNKKKIKIPVKACIIAGGVGLLAVNVLNSETLKAEEIHYPEFKKLVSQKNVDEIKFSRSNETLIIIDNEGNLFKTINPGYESFREEHLSQGIKFSEIKNIDPLTTISLAVSCAILTVVSKQMNIGKSNARKIGKKNIPKERLDDVSGLEEIKDDFKLAVKYLENPKEFSEYGANLPTGMILYGPPGTGKTMLAKSLAGEANVPFFNINGSEFVELFAGAGAKKVRSLFDDARKNAPCIIFIDEIDAVGKKRTNGATSNDEKDQTLNELLVQLDGFNSNEGVLVISATNRIETLDDALLRPGRFGTHIKIPLPKNKKERYEILKVHAKNKKVDDDMLSHISKITTGFSGADLENFLNQCALLQILYKKESIDFDIINKALFKIVTKGSRVLSKHRTDSENKIIAWHEAGHALASKLYGEDFVQVTITGSSSGLGGFSLSSRESEKISTKSDLENEIKVLYCGRIAESLILGDNITVGASNDIEKASKLISNMISYYGMNKDNTLLNLDVIEDKRRVVKEAEEIAKRLYESAQNDMLKHKNILEDIANTLIEEETLYNEDITNIMEKHEITK